jgi:hypothetical protein
VSYDDGRVACTDDALVIRLYYFPFGDKRIPYANIGQVRRAALTGMGGRYRLWGSGDFIHWANYDPDRPKKSVALIVSISGRHTRPVITPDDPDAVAAELASHGVTVGLAGQPDAEAGAGKLQQDLAGGLQGGDLRRAQVLELSQGGRVSAIALPARLAQNDRVSPHLFPRLPQEALGG